MAALAALTVLTSCSSTTVMPAGSSAPRSSTPAPTGSGAAGPNRAEPAVDAQPGRVVVVVLENHSYSDIIGNPDAPYLNQLAAHGTSFTDMHAVTHPSEPNYLALFSGSTHGVIDDLCPLNLDGDNLAAALRRAGLSFVGYSEDLPHAGSDACTAGSYARKHAPWTNYAALPASTNLPLVAFPASAARLPTVSFVIPNLAHDMHDGSVSQSDTWVRQHLGGYQRWAATHHSLLVVTWDEDDRSEGNRIPTIVVGAGVAVRKIGTRVSLYSLLRAIEDRYGLPRLGASASAPALLLVNRPAG